MTIVPAAEALFELLHEGGEIAYPFQQRLTQNRIDLALAWGDREELSRKLPHPPTLPHYPLLNHDALSESVDHQL